MRLLKFTIFGCLLALACSSIFAQANNYNANLNSNNNYKNNLNSNINSYNSNENSASNYNSNNNNNNLHHEIGANSNYQAGSQLNNQAAPNGYHPNRGPNSECHGSLCNGANPARKYHSHEVVRPTVYGGRGLYNYRGYARTPVYQPAGLRPINVVAVQQAAPLGARYQASSYNRAASRPGHRQAQRKGRRGPRRQARRPAGYQGRPRAAAIRRPARGPRRQPSRGHNRPARGKGQGRKQVKGNSGGY